MLSIHSRLPVAQLLLFCIVLLIMGGCSSVGYYSQSVIGHSRLMLARTPIDKAIAKAEPQLRKKLELSKQLKRFAESQLALPNNNSYNTFVALEREFPVWTVVATPELSLSAKQWCYPVIGCASYRGYFALEAAQSYAAKLQQKGFDITVGGASAYSTLGWFADPLLPSMMRYSDADFAETLFHELAHQVLYVNGDSGFNEAFATVVGEHGARLWLQSLPSGKQTSEAQQAYLQRLAARLDFYHLLVESKTELDDLFNQSQADIYKRQAKQAVFVNLRFRYEQLKQRQWHGKPWFDRWFEKPLNNARLAALSTYRDLVPSLEALLLSCESDFERFYRRLSKEKKAGEPFEVPSDCNQ